MIKSALEKMAKEIGLEIGTSDDIVQSNLLNGFSEGLKNSIKDKHNLDMQLCYISKQLNSKSKFIVKALAEFIDLEEKE